MLIFFAESNVKSFCYSKIPHTFSAKNGRVTMSLVKDTMGLKDNRCKIKHANIFLLKTL